MGVTGMARICAGTGVRYDGDMELYGAWCRLRGATSLLSRVSLGYGDVSLGTGMGMCVGMCGCVCWL